MMTVIDEVKSVDKYHYITWVEFLDFTCRIAIVGITMQDMIDYKVHLLMEILYKAL